jgi:hypothetical protein
MRTKEQVIMKRFFIALAALLLLALPAPAQQGFQDPFLDHLIGKWLLRGTIEGAATTHDVVFDWVLDHQYVRLHEVSRETNAAGRPAYEAMVFIGRDPQGPGYACLWLDSTGGGGLAAQAIGRGRRVGDELAFRFEGGNGSVFHTTFAYDPGTGSWEWRMDGEENGQTQPFARVRLTRE